MNCHIVWEKAWVMSLENTSFHTAYSTCPSLLIFMNNNSNMKKLNKDQLGAINGGAWSTIWKAFTAGAAFVLGADFTEEWKKGWNDPYGKD